MGRGDRRRVEAIRVEGPDDRLVLARRLLDANRSHAERGGAVGDGDQLERAAVFGDGEGPRVVALRRAADEDDGVGAEGELAVFDGEGAGVGGGHRGAGVDRHREEGGAARGELDEGGAAAVFGEAHGSAVVEDDPGFADDPLARLALGEVRERDVASEGGGGDVGAGARVGHDGAGLAVPRVDGAAGVGAVEDVGGSGAGGERALGAARHHAGRVVGGIGGVVGTVTICGMPVSLKTSWATGAGPWSLMRRTTGAMNEGSM